jgi:hypothetical protein
MTAQEAIGSRTKPRRYKHPLDIGNCGTAVQRAPCPRLLSSFHIQIFRMGLGQRMGHCSKSEGPLFSIVTGSCWGVGGGLCGRAAGFVPPKGSVCYETLMEQQQRAKRLRDGGNVAQPSPCFVHGTCFPLAVDPAIL